MKNYFSNSPADEKYPQATPKSVTVTEEISPVIITLNGHLEIFVNRRICVSDLRHTGIGKFDFGYSEITNRRTMKIDLNKYVPKLTRLQHLKAFLGLI